VISLYFTSQKLLPAKTRAFFDHIILRGPSLESPQESETNLFAVAASTIPRALLS